MQKQKPVVTEHDYEKDVSSSIQWNRWLLIPIGAWPNFRKSMIGKYFSSLINILCFGLIAFMFVSCGLYALIEIEELYHKIELLGPLIFFLMTFIKYYLLILHENDIREGCKRIEWDWKNIEHQEDRNIMTQNASYGRRLAAICTFFLFSAFAFHYIIVPISMGKVVDESGNLSFASLPFPVPGFIADVRYSPCNEIFYFIQTLTGAVMHTVTSAACSIAAVFAVHACGQMKVMMNWLEHLVDGRPDMSNTVNGRIAKIVIQHNRILKRVKFT